MVRFFLIIFSALLLLGCKGKEVLSEQQQRYHELLKKIEYRDRVQHDSIYIHDSIFVMVKGDTVYKDRIKYVTVTKLKTDTAYICKTDTLYISQREVVKAQLSYRDMMKIKSFPYMAGAIFLVTCAAYVGWKLKS